MTCPGRQKGFTCTRSEVSSSCCLPRLSASALRSISSSRMRLLREPTDTAEGGDPLLLPLDVLLAVLEPLDPDIQQCTVVSTYV